MGSSLKRVSGLLGLKTGSKKALLLQQIQQQQQYNSPEAKVARGEGRMIDGQYQAFSAGDKAHYDAAEANKNAAYQDISEGSALGQYFGNNSLLESIRKKKEAVKSTLLGGNPSNLGG